MVALLVATFSIAISVTPAEASTGAKKKQASSASASKSSARPAKAPARAQARQARAGARKQAPRKARAEVVRPSMGHIAGLQHTDDALDLKSSVALVVDQETNEVLFSKNPDAVLPIASITKLMTALVVTEAAQPLDELLTVSQADVDATAGSRSRLKLGTQLSRLEMLHLALMASENRAAHVLGRTYPGGLRPFIEAMNAKASLLGMHDSRYVEPTGLSADNRSSAHDLTLLVRAAYQHPLIRELSTTQEAMLPVGTRNLAFRNTNGLVHNPEWTIGLQKTGYIAAAGRCVVMQAQLAGRKLIMVLLDSAGRYSRIGDAERLRRWLADAPFLPSAVAAPAAGAVALPSPVQAPR